MKCLQVREQLSAFLDGALDERTLELVEAHLEGCAECRGEADSTRLIVEAAQCIGSVDPPARLRAAIARAVSEAEPCRQAAALLSPYLDGELDHSQAELVASHLEVCAHCAGELRELRTLVGAASEAEPVDPPSDLRVRIAAATTGRAGLLESVFGWRQWRRLAGAAGATAVIVAAMVLFRAPGVQQAAAPKPVASEERPAAVAPKRLASPQAPAVAPVAAAAVVAGRSGTQTLVLTPPRRVRPAPAVTARPARLIAVKPSVKPSAKPRIEHAPSAEEAAAEEVVLKTEAAVEEVTSEVVSVPAPAPPIEKEPTEARKPALIKVASAPAIGQDDVEVWLNEAKARAAMRRADSKSVGVSLFSARF